MNWKTGDIVVSKAGHDKGSIYVVVGRQEDGRLFVADGKRKKIETPKVKKHKHLEKIGMLEETLAEALNPKQVCLKRKEAPETHACANRLKLAAQKFKRIRSEWLGQK